MVLTAPIRAQITVESPRPSIPTPGPASVYDPDAEATGTGADHTELGDLKNDEPINGGGGWGCVDSKF